MKIDIKKTAAVEDLVKAAENLNSVAKRIFGENNGDPCMDTTVSPSGGIYSFRKLGTPLFKEIDKTFYLKLSENISETNFVRKVMLKAVVYSKYAPSIFKLFNVDTGESINGSSLHISHCTDIIAHERFLSIGKMPNQITPNGGRFELRAMPSQGGAVPVLRTFYMEEFRIPLIKIDDKD